MADPLQTLRHHVTGAIERGEAIAIEGKPMTDRTAIVDFRTMARGAYKWIKSGQNRGYWRVLVVRDPAGSRRVNSHNVESVIYEGPEGIDGTTERSAYFIGHSMVHAQDIADKFNKGVFHG